MKSWPATGLFLLVLCLPTVAQGPPSPPSPAKFKVQLRYDIPAVRDVHVALYDAMIRHLQSLEFEFNPPLEKIPRTNREDRSQNLLHGTIASGQVLKILRNSSVATLLIVPELFDVGEDPTKLLTVRLELNGELTPDLYRELGNQTRLLLSLLEFREATGYDSRGYSGRAFTRLVGSIPAGKLDLLLKDLRLQPTDWFTRVFDRADLPLPLRQVNPIRLIEVLPEPVAPKEPPPPEDRGDPTLNKIHPDLFDQMKKAADDDKVVRVQVLMIGSPKVEDAGVFRRLQIAAPSLVIDGVLGQVLTGTVELGQVRALAKLANVSYLRPVRFAGAAIEPGGKLVDERAKLLKDTGLADLHRQGQRGQGVRLVILDTDFRGWEGLTAAKKLPPRTQLIDLTTERDVEIYPAPTPGDPEQLGHGTQCALAAALAAPDVELLLVRIDGVDPYQMFEIIRYIRGGDLSEAMKRRRDEIFANIETLRLRREKLTLQRHAILENYTDEADLERNFDFLGPAFGWVFSDRRWLYAATAFQEQLEKDLAGRYQRFVRLTQEVRKLQGAELAVTPLSWHDGYPLGGASPFSRWFAEQTTRPPLWIQAVGNTRGQAWTGLVRDADRNGVMEFAPRGQPLKKGRWSSELNFVGFQRYHGLLDPELPKDARLKISFQWREPHDADYYTRSAADDPYLVPLVPLQLVLLRQRDPAAKTMPADLFDVAGRSWGLPQRLEHQPTYSIYEQVLEVPLEQGRYAVRIEKFLDRQWMLKGNRGDGKGEFFLLKDLVSTGLRPVGEATLPGLEKKWEMKARLFVDFVDPATRPKGRPVLLDYATDEGTVGLPADSRGVVSVGAADVFGQSQPYSASGPPAFLELASRPHVLLSDQLPVVPAEQRTAFGTSLSASFTAGFAACRLSAGRTRQQVWQDLAGGRQ